MTTVEPIEILTQPIVLSASVGQAPLDVNVADPAPVIVDVTEAAVAVAVVDQPTDVSIALLGAQGIPGRVGAAVTGETPAGTLNGANTVFTTNAPFVSGTTAVYLNGLREFHFTETGPNQITFEDPPSSSDVIRIDYVI